MKVETREFIVSCIGVIILDICVFVINTPIYHFIASIILVALSIHNGYLAYKLLAKPVIKFATQELIEDEEIEFIEIKRRDEL